MSEQLSENIGLSNKALIINNFKTLIYKANASDEKGATFKAREYTDTIKALSEFDGEIASIADAEKMLKDYGKKNPSKTLIKIKEILTTGTLASAEEAKKNPLVLAVSNLTTVYSIGNKKAIRLHKEYGIVTIDQLRKKVEKDPSIIHGKQKIGLTYYEDLNERIPRKEMLDYEEKLLEIAKIVDSTIKLSINGSFRRNMPTSGDIDVLITSKNKGARIQFIKYLKKAGIIRETLANGSKKFMGVSILPGYNKFRHIDIIESTLEDYAFGVLYFTGSGGFNIKMRTRALTKGYSINEFRLSDYKTKKPVSPEIIKQKIGKTKFEEEKDIFDFLDMVYIEPKDRINITTSKIH